MLVISNRHLYFLFIKLIISIHNCFSQDSILVEELKDVQFEVSASKQGKLYSTFDLTARKNYVRSVIDIGTHKNIGVYVPTKASKFISIRNIQFKIWNFKDNKEIPIDTSISLYSVHLFIPNQQGNDSIIALTPTSITYNKKQLVLHMNDIISLHSSIKGFYIFIKFFSKNTVDEYFLVQFNNKYASSFTYWLDEQGVVKPFVFPLLEENKENAYLNKYRARANFGVKVRYLSE